MEDRLALVEVVVGVEGDVAADLEGVGGPGDQVAVDFRAGVVGGDGDGGPLVGRRGVKDEGVEADGVVASHGGHGVPAVA